MKNLSLSFCLILFLTQNALAQSFWTENFSNGFPRGWTTEDLSGQNVDWIFANNPELISDFEKFNSSSVENGFMVARGRPLTDPHFSTLTTTQINCSTRDKVFLSFESFVLTNFVSAAKGVRVLVKNEKNDWQSFDVMPEQTRENAQQRSPNPYKSFIDISAAAANYSAVEIRWQWEGLFEEFWALDDVALMDYQPYYDRVVWGDQPGEGDFTGGIGSWHQTVIDAPRPSENRWKWESTGSIENALISGFLGEFTDFPYLDSYSNHTGAMVFNADFYTTGDSIAVAPPYPSYHAELISPLIDLSSVKNEVNVRFEQLFMKAGTESNENPSTTSFSFSTDGGRTWTAPIGLNYRDNELVRNTQTISICDAAGHGNVRLKFIFDGDLYFWAIDDVVIIEKEKNDARVRDDFFAIAPNVITPASQRETIRFVADVENFGKNKQTNVQLMVNIVERTSGQSVFKDTLAYGDLEKCEVVENVLFKKGFLPPNRAANYEATYYIQSDSLDDLTANDSLHWSFEIGDTTYSKETGATTSMEPIHGRNFEYGNVFFVPKGNNHTASSITFGIKNSASLQDASVNIFLYRFYADQDNDGFLEENELDIVGLYNHTFTGNEEQATGGIITVPISDLEFNPVVLEDNAYYLATIQYIDDDGRPCQMLASKKHNYLATWFAFDALSSNRYAGVEKVANKFDLWSLNFDLVPVIRLNVNGPTSAVSQIQETPFFAISPNPTTDFFTIKNKIPDLKTVELFDVKGSLIKKWKYQEDKEFEVSEIPSGSYFLKFSTEKAYFSRKLIISSK